MFLSVIVRLSPRLARVDRRCLDVADTAQRIRDARDGLDAGRCGPAIAFERIPHRVMDADVFRAPVPVTLNWRTGGTPGGGAARPSAPGLVVDVLEEHVLPTRRAGLDGADLEHEGSDGGDALGDEGELDARLLHHRHEIVGGALVLRHAAVELG